MRTRIFAERCIKELLRDPLSWIFCLAFPLLMLGIMTLLYESIPAAAAPVIFRLDYLAPGIAVFSFCFIMLFAALITSKDRSSAFLIRLFLTPMRASDFLLGYALPLFAMALGQIFITYAAAAIVGACTGTALHPGDMLLSALCLLPAIVMFLSLGMLFGTLFSEKAAPGISSIFISASSILGGIWMDVDSIGGGIAAVCRALPFYHAVRLGRGMMLDTPAAERMQSLLIVCLWACAVSLLACLSFRRKMKAR